MPHDEVMTNLSGILITIVTSAGRVLGVVGTVALVAGSLLTTYLDLIGDDSDLTAGRSRREGALA